MEVILLKPLRFIFQRIALIFSLILPFAYSTQAFSTEILVLHSGFQSDPQTHEIQRGIESAFNNLEVSLYVSYLDSGHQDMSDKESLAYADFLSQKFEGKYFDAVIITGKNALKLVQRLFSSSFHSFSYYICWY